MPVVPSSHTFVDGVATSSEANSFIRDPIAFLLTPPIAELRQTTPQSIPNAAFTAITFNTHDVDTDYLGGAMHSDTVDPSRATANFPGWYLVSGGISIAVNATGIRVSNIRVNGSDINGSGTRQLGSAAVDYLFPIRTKRVYLNVGDYVEVVFFQNAGGPLSTNGTTIDQSTMSVKWDSN